METTESSLKNMYHILVKETRHQHTTEWFGYLTILPQENGEIFVDLSFADQPVIYASQDRACDHGDSGVFIECLAQQTLSEVIHADDTGKFEQQIYHTIGLSINSFVDQED